MALPFRNAPRRRKIARKGAKIAKKTFILLCDLGVFAPLRKDLFLLRMRLAVDRPSVPGFRKTTPQLLPQTLALGPEVWRVLAKCHDVRNLAEYEETLDIDKRIIADLLEACDRVFERVEALS